MNHGVHDKMKCMARIMGRKSHSSRLRLEDLCSLVDGWLKRHKCRDIPRTMPFPGCKQIDGTTEFMMDQWHPHCPRWLGKSTQVEVLDDYDIYPDHDTLRRSQFGS